MSSLFRDEALRAQQGRYLGSIRIARNPSFTLVAGVSLLLGAALIAFSILGHFTRKARVPGVLLPTLGTLNIPASQTGTLLELRIAEGDHVAAGQVVAVLGVDRTTKDGDAAVLVARSLAHRRETLETERRLANEQARQRHDALTERLRSIEKEQTQASDELVTLRRRVQLAVKSVERFEALAREGFVAEVQAQQKNEELLDLRMREQTTERILTALQRDSASVKADLAGIGSTLNTQLMQVERSLATLEQEITENEARAKVVIATPCSATVTAVVSHVGQVVQTGQNIAAVVPAFGNQRAQPTLEAHLFAPSRTAGFVKAGQAVWIRYAAYPYQKFGMAAGRIASVSRTPINPQDLPTGQGQAILQATQSNEPLYRVTVTLANQSINTYGEQQALKPGMSLEADVLQDRRAIWEWILEPVIAASTPARL